MRYETLVSINYQQIGASCALGEQREIGHVLGLLVLDRGSGSFGSV